MSDIRFVTLLPDQVTRRWDLLRPQIERGLPPISVEDPNRMANILEDICAGQLNVHVFCRLLGEGKTEFLAILVTGKTWWFGSKHKDLLLFSLSGFAMDFSQEDWLFGLNLVKLYAKGLGCKRVMAYSNIPGVIRLVERAGGNADYRLLTIDLDKWEVAL